MDRCNDLCPKEAIGTCALCDALAERDRFEEFWFKGGLFVDGVHAMQRRGVFTLLHRYALPLALLFLVGLMLWLAWVIPRSGVWHSTISRFVQENPIFVRALILSLLIPLFWLLLWKFPQWQVAAVPEVKDRIDLESKARQTIAQILGGAALLVGLYFTWQTLHISQEGQITDRFTKAIDQLGKDALNVRLGGIYALERIAKDSPKDHWQIMEVLTAYVREHAPWPPKKGQPTENEQGKPDTDIQAILTVLGRRMWTQEKGERQVLDLRNTDLRRADLRGAHLERVWLMRAHLEGAFLTNAHLAGAQFYEAHLERARLDGADLTGAGFWGAHLEEAILSGAQLGKAHLQRAHLEKASLGL